MLQRGSHIQYGGSIHRIAHPLTVSAPDKEESGIVVFNYL